MNSETVCENLTCPITTQIFLKPVMTNTGITYEKEAICKWLKQSQKCPQTNGKITSICESFLIKNLVEAYLNANPDKKIDQYKESGEEYKNPFDIKNTKKVPDMIQDDREQDNREMLAMMEALYNQRNNRPIRGNLIDEYNQIIRGNGIQNNRNPRRNRINEFNLIIPKNDFIYYTNIEKNYYK